MSLIHNFWNEVKYIFKPSFWIMNKQYNPVIDAVLKEIIEKDKVIVYNEHYAYTKNLEIWIANYPYGYATISGGRPSRYMIEEFARYLAKHPERFTYNPIPLFPNRW